MCCLWNLARACGFNVQTLNSVFTLFRIKSELSFLLLLGLSFCHSTCLLHLKATDPYLLLFTNSFRPRDFCSVAPPLPVHLQFHFLRTQLYEVRKYQRRIPKVNNPSFLNCDFFFKRASHSFSPHPAGVGTVPLATISTLYKLQHDSQTADLSVFRPSVKVPQCLWSVTLTHSASYASQCWQHCPHFIPLCTHGFIPPHTKRKVSTGQQGVLGATERLKSYNLHSCFHSYCG